MGTRRSAKVRSGGVRRVPRHVAIAAVLAALVIAVFWRVGSFPFIVLDDEPYLVTNRAVQGGLSMEGLRWAFTPGMDAGFIPLTWISRLVDITLFGMDAGKHHLVNVLFHLLNAVLLFEVLRRMTGRLWESALVGALFAIHPVHVESVAWVTERKDVLAGFFFLLCLGAYARYAEKPGGARYGLVVLFFALGLLSKPVVVTLPFVLLLLDAWPLGRFPWFGDDRGGLRASRHRPRYRVLLLEKVPLLALSAAVCVITILGQERVGAVASLELTPLWARAGNALLSYVGYLRRAAWPSGLAVIYPHPGTRLALWDLSAAGLFLCLGTAMAVVSGRRRGWPAVGWFWYLGTLVPVIGLVRIGSAAMADRYAYIPLIGIYMTLAWGLGELTVRLRLPRPAMAAAAALWLVLLAASAWSQVGYWRNSESLFRRALAVTEENWLAHYSLGQVALGEGRDAEAAYHYRESLRIWPGHAEAYNNLGVVLARRGSFQEAVPLFREALRIKPSYEEARSNLGNALRDIERR